MILAFTMPVWTVLRDALLLGQRLTRRASIASLCAVAAIAAATGATFGSRRSDNAGR